ncbi:hypothetical protein, conserved [Eimeria tenella]|uniref:Uncharacterized protein n=1 Tax=Eimeria tenella TaxID=5802 RepID=U6KXX1_EIMTE|nr:hypothetical protein, conserved [Eimeria tenella]CDJ41793.1 hypothetical protein, conserved [Eimeria tenella]|eukprot:XP_013232543.1 hypothetical protein, conserved [Eimeria tenella]
MGPLLRRLLRRGGPLGAPQGPPKGAPQGANQGAPQGAPNFSVEVYLTDIDLEALQLCRRTQQLDEFLLAGPPGDPLGGPSGGPPGGPLVEGYGAPTTPTGSPAAAACVQGEGPPVGGPPVKVFVRRLDWTQGGPWGPLLAKGTSTGYQEGPPSAGHPLPNSANGEGSGLSGGDQGPPRGALGGPQGGPPGASSGGPLGGPPGGAPQADEFSWSQEELETLGAKGAVDLVLACDVLYDFDLNWRLALLLQQVLQQNPCCCCLVSHSRRLGFVCASSFVAVDVFAEDFWDRFCCFQDDPSPPLSSSFFQLYVHPTPACSLRCAAAAAPKTLEAALALTGGPPEAPGAPRQTGSGGPSGPSWPEGAPQEEGPLQEEGPPKEEGPPEEEGAPKEEGSPEAEGPPEGERPPEEEGPTELEEGPPKWKGPPQVGGPPKGEGPPAAEAQQFAVMPWEAEEGTAHGEVWQLSLRRPF